MRLPFNRGMPIRWITFGSVYPPFKPVIFITMKGTTLRNILILDLVAGTGIYYLLKMITLSKLLASAGSYIGTEGYKKYKDLFRPYN